MGKELLEHANVEIVQDVDNKQFEGLYSQGHVVAVLDDRSPSATKGTT